jgi:hypothetical protein
MASKKRKEKTREYKNYRVQSKCSLKKKKKAWRDLQRESSIQSKIATSFIYIVFNFLYVQTPR